MKNLETAYKVISYCEKDFTIQNVINTITKHPDQNDIIDYVLNGIGSVCEQFKYVFTCKEFLEFITDSEEKSHYNQIQEAKQFLKDNGYYTDILWCVDDIKSKFECSDEQAQTVLNGALNNDATMEQIWFAIGVHGEIENLTPIEEEEEENE